MNPMGFGYVIFIGNHGRFPNQIHGSLEAPCLATVNGSSMVVKTLGCRVELSIFDLGCIYARKKTGKNIGQIQISTKKT